MFYGAVCLSINSFSQQTKTDSFLLNDSHFHLTNYVQEGTDIHKFLQIMGNKVGRVALFGIPLQQLWELQQQRQLCAYILPGQ
jgi:hypothetical protein